MAVPLTQCLRREYTPWYSRSSVAGNSVRGVVIRHAFYSWKLSGSPSTLHHTQLVITSHKYTLVFSQQKLQSSRLHPSYKPAVWITIEPKAVVHCGPGITSSTQLTHWTLVSVLPIVSLTPDLGVVAIHSSLLIMPSYLWMECPHQLVKTCNSKTTTTSSDEKSNREASTTYLNKNHNTQDITTYLDRIHNRCVPVTDIRF
ncbi:uncharacterized protein UHO2_00146 [Ustilago hordei]|uniref:uncharacterized protein n=1 Tax=Ustilago hordei TaxID=120017 RepID=UPI001A5B8C33|nr:uncharacterized protein UHO2_00146 [Ustilago hordei]SYW81622.1 uncharacterized protein UHO2_00146 [Ustilago hordei]